MLKNIALCHKCIWFLLDVIFTFSLIILYLFFFGRHLGSTASGKQLFYLYDSLQREEGGRLEDVSKWFIIYFDWMPFEGFFPFFFRVWHVLFCWHFLNQQWSKQMFPTEPQHDHWWLLRISIWSSLAWFLTQKSFVIQKKTINPLIQSCQRFEHLEVQQLLMITFEYTERFHLSFWLNCLWFFKFEWAWLESFLLPPKLGHYCKTQFGVWVKDTSFISLRSQCEEWYKG